MSYSATPSLSALPPLTEVQDASDLEDAATAAAAVADDRDAAEPSFVFEPAERRGPKKKFDWSRALRVRRAGEKEALLLTIICALDMYSTLWWVVNGNAHEANALLAWTFSINPALFIIVKGASCLPALLLAPRLAQKHPKLVIYLLRTILACYLASYVGGIYMTTFR